MLALASVLGGFGGGEASGSKGAVSAIASQPFGIVLLIALIVGLLAYVAWRFVQGIADSEGKGSSAAGWVQRIGIMISGLTYLSLAIYAVTLTGWFASSQSGGGSTQKALTARLMSYEWGVWLVGIVGVVFALVGGYQVYRALSRKFTENWQVESLSTSAKSFAVGFGQFGIGIRGLTFVLIGALIVQAAINTDPSQAQGLGQALQTLHDQPYGAVLLGGVALGLLCYGAYCFLNACIRSMSVD